MRSARQIASASGASLAPMPAAQQNHPPPPYSSSSSRQYAACRPGYR